MRIPIGSSVSGLDNARISSKISASRSGGSGDMLIYLRDAADLNLCLPLPSFLLTKAGIRIIRERQTIPLQTSAIKNAALDSCMCIGFLPNGRLANASLVRRIRLCRALPRNGRFITQGV